MVAPYAFCECQCMFFGLIFCRHCMLAALYSFCVKIVKLYVLCAEMLVLVALFVEINCVLFCGTDVFTVYYFRKNNVTLFSVCMQMIE